MKEKKNIGWRIFWLAIGVAFVGLIAVSFMIKAPEPEADAREAKNVTVRDLVERPEKFHEGDVVIVSGSASHGLEMKQEMVFDDMEPRDASQYIPYEFRGYTDFKTPILLASKKVPEGGDVFSTLRCEVRRSSGGLYLLEKEVMTVCRLPQDVWVDNKCAGQP